MKSAGNKKTLEQARKDKAYIESAAKLCKFQIDANERAIYVPYTMEAEALEDLTVRHLTSLNLCRIELTIEETIPERKEFAPVFRERIKPDPVSEVYPYNPGEAYRIVNSSRDVELTRVEKGIKGGLNYWFEYVNLKPGSIALEPFKMYGSELKRMIDFKLWIRVN